MFSAIQYFEAKQLSLASLCYIMTMALLCSLYMLFDRPEPHLEKNAGYVIESGYWVSYELNDDLQAKDIHQKLLYVISNLNMRDVSYTLACNNNTCQVSFVPLTKAGRNVADSALGSMRNVRL